MKRNTLDEVQEKLRKLTAERAAELEKVEAKRKEAEKDLLTALSDVEAAAEKTDFTVYEKAKERERKAQQVVEMFSERCSQLKKQEYMSKEERDAVLRSLIKYDQQITIDFRNDVRTALNSVAAIAGEYFREGERTRNLYRDWSKAICSETLEFLPWDNSAFSGARSMLTKVNQQLAWLDQIDGGSSGRAGTSAD